MAKESSKRVSVAAQMSRDGELGQVGDAVATREILGQDLVCSVGLTP